MKVGWFHQHQIEALAADDTPLQIIGRALPEPDARRSGAVALAQFGFGADRVETKVESPVRRRAGAAADQPDRRWTRRT